jgi:sulfoxide reductase heme-binding subunit YedZ
MTETKTSRIDRDYLLWICLALPGAYLIVEFVVLHAEKVPYLRWSGLMSCWLLILTMSITPLSRLVGSLRWLRKRRRYFGVASFAYAGLHFGFWLTEANIGALMRSFQNLRLGSGWIALALFTLLAATSFDLAVRRLGPNWKRLQRLVYPSAVMTLVHWALTASNIVEVVVYSTPLILLETVRVIGRRRQTAS